MFTTPITSAFYTGCRISVPEATLAVSSMRLEGVAAGILPNWATYLPFCFVVRNSGCGTVAAYIANRESAQNDGEQYAPEKINNGPSQQK
jgi:hypothetical protein